jgi:hypothetical protein
MIRRRRREDDEDLLGMAFGAAPFIDDLRAARDPEDDPEGDEDDEDEEDDPDEDEAADEGEFEQDELDF